MKNYSLSAAVALAFSLAPLCASAGWLNWDVGRALRMSPRVVAVVPATPSAFGAESATLTNRYSPLTVGQRLTYHTYGIVPTATATLTAAREESLDNVNCLVINAVVSQAGQTARDTYWVAEDVDKNVWILQYRGADGSLNKYGVAGALPVFTENPELGDVWRMPDGDSETITNTSAAVAQLSTGLGPYANCVETTTDNGGGDLDWLYYAPGVGEVLEVWNDDGQQNGLELSSVGTVPGDGGGGGGCFLHATDW